MIMVGLGTGLAPFRSLIQDRVAIRRDAVAHGASTQSGSVTLYFGCRKRTQDFLFGDELEGYVKEGGLTAVRAAFSRDQAKKVYVQHRIVEDAPFIADALVNKVLSFSLLFSWILVYHSAFVCCSRVDTSTCAVLQSKCPMMWRKPCDRVSSKQLACLQSRHVLLSKN